MRGMRVYDILCLIVSVCVSLSIHAAAALLALGPPPWHHRGGHRALAADIASGRPMANPQFTMREMPFGESGGSGSAINSSDLWDQPLEARRGEQDQAWLSRTGGFSGRLPDLPFAPSALSSTGNRGPTVAGVRNESSTPFGASSAPAAAPRVARRAPVHVPAASVPEMPPAAQRPVESPASSAQPAAAAPAPAAEGRAAASPPAAVAPAAHLAAGRDAAGHTAGTASAGGGGGPPGDPAPRADSDSDAFSRAGSVIFRPGRVDAQLGCRVKAVKPRLTVKALVDLASLENPAVVMKVSVDETGKVTDVALLRSSGSNEIDLPVMLAMYSWWIEPPRDQHNRPRPHTRIIAVRLYN